MTRHLRTVATVVLAVLAMASSTHAGQAGSPVRLRVLSYNIHHGEGADGKLDLERIARIIRSASPDLVALQEVDQNLPRTGHVDQPAELARLTEMHVAFGANYQFDGGHYGNAALSRRPIRRHQNHALPMPVPGEPRGLLEVEIELASGEPLVLFATHFDHRPVDRSRRESAMTVNELVAASPNRLTVLAGDLNAVPKSEVLDLLRRSWSFPPGGDFLTSPATRPRRQIDYVLVRPSGRWRNIEINVLDEPVASDHRPILLTAEIPPSQ